MVKKKTILFADDEYSIRELYKTRFAKETNLKVIFATDGEDALAKIKEDSPELVLLDIMMPQKSGLEVLEEMKKDPQMADIPAIIFTVLDDINIKNKAIDLGAMRYLVKSQVMPPEVVKIIKEKLFKKD